MCSHHGLRHTYCPQSTGLLITSNSPLGVTRLHAAGMWLSVFLQQSRLCRLEGSTKDVCGGPRPALWHGVQVQQWAKVIKEVQEEEAARDDTWVERNSKPCKGCGARIQKTGGCNHLVCSRCKHQFCWVSCYFYAIEGRNWVIRNRRQSTNQSLAPTTS